MNDRTFWTHAWAEGHTGFHKDGVHPDLPAFEEEFLGDGPHRVLVPLCGKSVDLVWLRARGHHVVGVEIVPQALEAFCAEQGLAARAEPGPRGLVVRADGLTLLCADFFEVEPEDVGPVDRIWDRAALVAIRPERRAAYAAHQRRLLAPGGRILLNLFEYDPSRMSGPPFSVPEADVPVLYPGLAAMRLQHTDLGGGGTFAGHDRFVVHTWQLEA